jgi:thiamine pyrophosphate-dependent acetolactate synthase large subunit-like protein
LLMQAFGGEGYAVNSRQQLVIACRQAFAARKPALINVAIDPLAGVESGVPAVMCMLAILCSLN